MIVQFFILDFMDHLEQEKLCWQEWVELHNLAWFVVLIIAFSTLLF